jgi:hypothetical protein
MSCSVSRKQCNYIEISNGKEKSTRKPYLKLGSAVGKHLVNLNAELLACE